MNDNSENPEPLYADAVTDLVFIRLLRSQMGEEWERARAFVLDNLPDDIDPKLLTKYVDDSDDPGIHINAHGVEPRFYAHRKSRRLLEFYRSK